MPNPLSADIRTRFGVLFAKGLLGREIGRRLMILAASASRLSQKLKQGLGLTPAINPRNTRHGKLGPHHDFLIELLHQGPDITLKELQGALADPHTGAVLARQTADSICAFWVLGHPNSDSGTGRLRSGRTLGHQRGPSHACINALPGNGWMAQLLSPTSEMC